MGLSCKVGHIDTSSFHVDGVYNSDQEDVPEGVIHITQGVSLDHRPDLNQVILQLICEHQSGIPLWMDALSGLNMAFRICNKLRQWGLWYHIHQDWSHIGFNRWREGTAIMSRYPMQHNFSAYVSVDHRKDNYMSRNITLSCIIVPWFGLLHVANVHLSWAHHGFYEEYYNLQKLIHSRLHFGVRGDGYPILYSYRALISLFINDLLYFSNTETSVMQTNDSNDAPPIVGTSYVALRIKSYRADQDSTAPSEINSPSTVSNLSSQIMHAPVERNVKDLILLRSQFIPFRYLL